MGKWAVRICMLVAISVALGACSLLTDDADDRVRVDFVPIPGSASANLVAVSPYMESAITGGESAVEFAVDPSKAASVAIMDVSRDFGWTAVWPAWFEPVAGTVSTLGNYERQGLEIGPLSTAVEMLYSLPIFYNGDLDVQADIIRTLRNLPEVIDLAHSLETGAAAGEVFEQEGFQLAFHRAIAAGIEAIGELDISELANTVPDRPDVLQVATVESLELPLDQIFTKFRIQNGRITPEWAVGGAAWGDPRGLSWIGRVYQVDASAFDSLAHLQASWATLDHARRTNVPIVGSSGYTGMYLGANTVYDIIDIVGYAVDFAFDFLDGAVSLAPSGVLLEDNRVYAAHLHTCGYGADGMGGANATADKVFMDNWAGGAGLRSYEMACVVNFMEAALSTISIVTDVGEFVGPEEMEKVVRSVMEKIAIKGAADLVKSDMWSSSSLAALAYNVTQGLVNSLASETAKKGLSARLKMWAKSLASSFDLLSTFSNTAELGARIGAMIAISPWEGAVIVTGNPWHVEQPVPDPDPDPNPVPDPDPNPDPDPGPAFGVPRINALTPSPVPPLDGRQWLTFVGENFSPAASVTLTSPDGPHLIPADRTERDSATQIRVYVNLTSQPDSWSAVITNPAPGESSLPFTFTVGSPGANADPVISSFTATPSSGDAPLDVRFRWNVSDADGDSLTCGIDFGDGESSTIVNCQANNEVWHTYEGAGPFFANLIVMDGNGGNASRSASIFVDVPPATGSPPRVNYFDAEASRAGSINRIEFFWDVSDPDGDPLTCEVGLSSSGTELDYSWTVTDCHTRSSFITNVSNPGTYTALIVVHDPSGFRDNDWVYVTVGPSFEPGELLQNGNFSSLSSGWTLTGDFWIGASSSGYHRSAPYLAAGGVDSGGYPKNNAYGSMTSAWFDVPSDASNVELTFWHNVTTQETANNVYDVVSVWVEDNQRYIPELLYTRNNTHGTSAGNYSRFTVNLNDFIGETIRITFEAQSDSTNPTVFRIDDVSVYVE